MCLWDTFEYKKTQFLQYNWVYHATVHLLLWLEEGFSWALGFEETCALVNVDFSFCFVLIVRLNYVLNLRNLFPVIKNIVQPYKCALVLCVVPNIWLKISRMFNLLPILQLRSGFLLLFCMASGNLLPVQVYNFKLGNISFRVVVGCAVMEYCASRWVIVFFAFAFQTSALFSNVRRIAVLISAGPHFCIYVRNTSWTEIRSLSCILWN